jgi:hypothetical protein
MSERKIKNVLNKNKDRFLPTREVADKVKLNIRKTLKILSRMHTYNEVERRTEKYCGALYFWRIK